MFEMIANDFLCRCFMLFIFLRIYINLFITNEIDCARKIKEMCFSSAITPYMVKYNAKCINNKENIEFTVFLPEFSILHVYRMFSHSKRRSNEIFRPAKHHLLLQKNKNIDFGDENRKLE